MHRSSSIATCVSLGLLALGPTLAYAQTIAPTVPTIRVSAEATVETPPDQAEIDLGVVTRSETSERAATDNARRVDAVLAALRRALPAATIRTVAYAVRPEYNRPVENQEPRIVGYTATNTVRVTLDELTKVGAIVDAAIMAGANTVQRIQFSLKKEEAARAEALKDAAVAARARADALAAALGLRITRIVSVSEESGTSVRPLSEVATFARAAAAPATPIDAGPIETRATVMLVLEVTAAP